MPILGFHLSVNERNGNDEKMLRRTGEEGRNQMNINQNFSEIENI